MLPVRPVISEIEMTPADGNMYLVRGYKVRHFKAEHNRNQRCYCGLNGGLWIRWRSGSQWSNWEAIKGRIESI